MGFRFPSIRMPSIRLPPIRLPPIKLPPPVRLPPPVKLPPPKVDMGALRTATGIIAGIVSITPMGRALVNVAVGIADATTHGKASQYLDNGHKSNGTLSLIPGGRLLQSVANEASHGKSGDTLTRYVPDPKKSLIHDVGVVGKTVITNPNNTGNALKSITQTHINNAKPTLHSIINTNSTVVSTLVKPTEKIIKPSLLQISRVKEEIRHQIPITNTLLPISHLAVVPIISTLGHDPIYPDTFNNQNNSKPANVSTLGVNIVSMISPPPPAVVSPPKSLFFFSKKNPVISSPVIPDNQLNSTLGSIDTTSSPVIPDNQLNSTLGSADTASSPVITDNQINSTLGSIIATSSLSNPVKKVKTDSKSDIPIIPITLVCLGIIILMKK